MLPGPALSLVSNNSICRCDITRMFFTSVYTFANTLTARCAHAACSLVVVRSDGVCTVCLLAFGDEGGKLADLCRAGKFVTWGVIFDRQINRCVVCQVASGLFFDGGGSACWCMCVYTHTHTHTSRRILRCEPRVRDETPRGPKESIDSISA